MTSFPSLTFGSPSRCDIFYYVPKKIQPNSTQQTLNCSKPTIKTLEKSVKNTQK